MNRKWDKRFLGLADYVSNFSKDPSTKVGCIIADDDKKVVGLGYNGFPKHIKDSPERLNNREEKYKYVVHAEINAIGNSNGSVKGCSAYIYPLPPCSSCIKVLMTHGIKRIVYPPTSDALRARWGKDLDFAAAMAREAGIELVELQDVLDDH